MRAKSSSHAKSTGSHRHHGPFVAVNCAALVETLLEAELFGIEDRTATGVKGRRGKFELADKGTLFLDEVGDLSPTAQAKLLRVLQDLSVERVGGQGALRSTCGWSPRRTGACGAWWTPAGFARILDYRLAGVEIYVPPLRARRDDIPLLVSHFAARFGEPGRSR